MVKKIFSISAICLSLLISATTISAETAVERHGKLKTSGPYLLNEHDSIVQLRGMSFYWSQWEGPQFYTADILNQLVDNWKCTVVRVAFANGNTGWSSCETVIGAAIKKGIYVIIDWHSHDAHTQESAAITFFEEQAKKYKDIPNVIFEPFNEPKWAGSAKAEVGDLDNAVKTWTAIKPYLKNVTKAIRATGAENLIILGTPYFAQFVNVAANDQVLDDGNKPFTNVAYTFHFYAASHGTNSYYMKQTGATSMVPGYLEGGLGKVPIFITEWGTSHSDGGKSPNTYVDEENTAWWFTNYVDKNHLSHCNWSVNNSGDASSAFAGGGGPSNPSKSGSVAKKYITVSTKDYWVLPAVAGKKGPAGDSTFEMPGTHPAVGYNLYWGANFDTVTVPFLLRDDKTNARTSRNLAINVTSGVGTGEWAEYKIKSTKATKQIIFRYVAVKGTGSANVLIDGKSIGTVSFTTTKADSSWEFKSIPAAVSTGDHTVRIEFTSATGDGYYISWFELSDGVATVPVTQNKINRHVSISTSGNGVILSLPQYHPYQSYALVGIDGRTVQSAVLSKGAENITVKNVSSGTYFVTFSGEQYSNTQKVIVNSR